MAMKCTKIDVDLMSCSYQILRTFAVRQKIVQLHLL